MKPLKCPNVGPGPREVLPTSTFFKETTPSPTSSDVNIRTITSSRPAVRTSSLKKTRRIVRTVEET